MIPEITVQELSKLKKEKAKFLLIDVRNQDEYDFCNLGGLLIPLPEFEKRCQELDKELHIIVHCHYGGRSSTATDFLLHQGFKNVHNLRGGIAAWSKEIDPSVPTY